MISVIIPNYNHANYLRQRIESIINQTYPDFEIILLDDSSTDNSKAVIETYRGHPKVAAIIYNDKNSGSAFRQWKRGLLAAKGTWCWIAESDDYAAPLFLETLMAQVKEDTGLAFAKSRNIDAVGRETSIGLRYSDGYSPFIHKADFDVDYYRTGRDEMTAHLIYNNTIPNASAAIFRRQLALSFIDRLLSFRLYGDWLLWLYLCSRSNVFYSAQPLNYYRHHEATVRSGMETQFESRLREANAMRNITGELLTSTDFTNAERDGWLQINNKELFYDVRKITGAAAREKGSMAALGILFRYKPALIFNPYLIKTILMNGLQG